MIARVREILDVAGLRSDGDFVRAVEERLPVAALDGLRRSGVTDEEIYLLVAPRRTLAHRRTRREPLSRDESDRAVRLARIIALAERVFGDPPRAWHWLRAAKRRFDGRTPLRFTATEAGGRLVEELLYSIDEGMAA
jgi:putative toxin-antitoxin system antitoxin component (TIGR02293 family)